MIENLICHIIIILKSFKKMIKINGMQYQILFPGGLHGLEVQVSQLLHLVQLYEGWLESVVNDHHWWRVVGEGGLVGISLQNGMSYEQVKQCQQQLAICFNYKNSRNVASRTTHTQSFYLNTLLRIGRSDANTQTHNYDICKCKQMIKKQKLHKPSEDGDTTLQ